MGMSWSFNPRLAIAVTVCAAFALRSTALPAPYDLAVRGNAVSGSAGDANGGDVIINGRPFGSISNTDGSAQGGAGGTSTSGNAFGSDGGDASSGDAGSTDGGSVTVSEGFGGSFTSSGNSTQGGAGGTSRSGNAVGGDASGNYIGYAGFAGFD